MLGETIALGVALSWTATALFAEVASKKLGSLPFNTLRMSLSLLLLAITLWLTLGTPYPRYADSKTWLWLLASGIVGYTIGDYCLMQGYILIGSRFGQLFMTLSAPTAAATGWLLLGERLHPLAIVGMIITLAGIALAVLARRDNGIHLGLPRRGVAYAAMAGLCQGIGLVLSKRGLQHYDAAISMHNLSVGDIPTEALLPLPLSISIPFAATAIRALVGLAGFYIALRLMQPQSVKNLRLAFSDRKAMLCVVGSTIFGPFIGVSASLLATQYTSAGIAQTLFSLTPVLIIAPSAWLFGQKVTARQVIGAAISVAGASLFFIKSI